MEVTIVDYQTKQNSKGEAFNTLILQGDVELVKSKETGQFYATSKTTSITCTFEDAVCEQLIGTKLPGRIEKIVVEPYEYQTPSGELLTLEHSYRFKSEDRIESNKSDLVAALEVA